MDIVKDFFIKIGFDFENGLKRKKFSIDDYPDLNSDLEGVVFFYDSPNQTNTSFYLIDKSLSKQELRIVKKYIWNESKADLLFYLTDESSSKLILQFAKVSPSLSDNDCELDSFNISIEEEEKIEQIKRWKFDSGVFWTNYQEFLSKIKNYKSIDKELIGTLQALKNQLINAFAFVENRDEREKYVQALIDRTLYIKYLEDNHIINSYFYEYNFGSSSIDYKELLSNADSKRLNSLFKIIHSIFNNELFENPEIPEEYLTKDICSLIFNSLNHNIEKGQLRLFDFRFDIIPVEFISYIYEIFLTDKQKEGGIYYTPKKLAQLIVDDVIPENEIGSVLDPSCGSGMFLIIAFQKLLENSKEHLLNDIEKRIEFRTKLIKENIFGIEKELTAQRFSLFSLSLQLFRGLDKTKIRDLIAKQLREKGKVELFKKYSFFNNILRANTLEMEESLMPHKDITFKYIVGNPPFFEIKNNSTSQKEIEFLKKYKINIEDKKIIAKNIVGKHQISQCFFIKIKEWSNTNTRFGFISNSSNFYNDKSLGFQHFFYSQYNIEKIYELSRVKNILFEKAKESVVSIVFTNEVNEKNNIEYYPVYKGLFSEKPFELLIIKEDNKINIEQSNILNNSFKLRYFYNGNTIDRFLIKKQLENNKLSSYLIKLDKTNDFVNNGLQIVGKEQLLSEFDLTEEEYRTLNKADRKKLSHKFKMRYTSDTQSLQFPNPVVYPRNLKSYAIENCDTFVNQISNFQRTRIPEIYTHPKILINRTGAILKAAFVKEKIFYNFDIYSIFPKSMQLSYLISAIINSKFINYYNDLVHRKRVDSSFTKIGYDAIKEIPIPINLDNDLVSTISKISKELTEGLYRYTDDISTELDNLIFDLYDLSYIEKQRIIDYFLPKKKISKSKNEIGQYKLTLEFTINNFLKTPVIFEEFYSGGFGLIVIKVNLNGNNISNATAKKTGSYLLNEIFEKNPQENFLASREKIWDKDCVYILKQDINTNWTQTKAFEDGQEILKRLLNGEQRVH
ncbi:N-6 DNA methylase [uncultured Draconibacterium sp.]|uniref:N-6 DNA methylase n=1 Tax=uncultured Draconibacterium sp. TaxID=1573823 RepID=UPI0029C63BEA|nr:N-6 DNA methylase [uncultured Draconibacterium sp.]